VVEEGKEIAHDNKDAPETRDNMSSKNWMDRLFAEEEKILIAFCEKGRQLVFADMWVSGPSLFVLFFGTFPPNFCEHL
jgi:hypothetical protein